MKRRPWMMFYCLDWRGDPRLRMCSLAARGLWIDFMSYMHEGEPYGHLTIDGVAPDVDGLASLVGRPTREVERALAELEAKNVFSRTNTGEIYSRRMVRDNAKAEQDRLHGKGGGNPNITNKVKSRVNPQVNGKDKAHIPESIEPERKEEDAPTGATTSGKYAFESGVIKLNQKSFDKWRQAFSYLDLRAELVALEYWAGKQTDWFHAVSGALAKRNREQKRLADKGSTDPPSPSLMPALSTVLGSERRSPIQETVPR